MVAYSCRLVSVCTSIRRYSRNGRHDELRDRGILHLDLGLGAVIITSANNFDTATMFVPIVILMVMAIGLHYVIGAVERWVAPWQAEIAGRDE